MDVCGTSEYQTEHINAACMPFPPPYFVGKHMDIVFVAFITLQAGGVRRQERGGQTAAGREQSFELISKSHLYFHCRHCRRCLTHTISLSLPLFHVAG